jgi:hypothetical protein
MGSRFFLAVNKFFNSQKCLIIRILEELSEVGAEFFR